MKCLLKIIAVCVLGVLLLVGAVVFGIESILTEAIRGGVAHATGQETELDGVEVAYGERKLGFLGLEIANPPGFQPSPMLKIGTIRASMAPEMIRNEVVLVDEVLLDGFEIQMELKGTESNVQVLMDHLGGDDAPQSAPAQPETKPDQEPTTEPAKPESAPQPRPADEPQTEFIIGRVQISGVKVNLHISDVPGISGVYSVSVPTIVMEDLDSKQAKADMTTWVKLILQTVLDRGLAAGKDVFPGEWNKLLESELAKSLLDGDLDGATKQLEEQANEELDKLIEKTDGAKGLIEEGGNLLEKSGISKDPTNALQKELKKASDLRKGLFDKD